MDASSISRGTPFTKLQNVITVKGIRNEIKIQINDEIQAANLENIKQVFVIGSDCTLNGCEIKAGNHRIELQSKLQANLETAVYASDYNKVETVNKIVYSPLNSTKQKSIVNTTLLIKEL